MCFEVSQQTSKSSTSMGSWTESEGIKFETAKVQGHEGKMEGGGQPKDIKDIQRSFGISWHDSLQEALAVCIFSLPFLRCVPLFCFYVHLVFLSPTMFSCTTPPATWDISRMGSTRHTNQEVVKRGSEDQEICIGAYQGSLKDTKEI